MIDIGTLTALAALDPTTNPAAWLAAPGRDGMFRWDGSDLSAVLSRPIGFDVDAGANQLSVGKVIATSMGATTVTVSGGHPFSEGEEITTFSSVNGCTAFGRYFAYSVAPTTFKVRTSYTAAALSFSGAMNATWCSLHGLWTGEAITVDITGNGLVAGDVVYVRRVSPGAVSVHATYKDARLNANPISLSGVGTIAARALNDPLMGRFVVPVGYAVDGSQGAYVRVSDTVCARHCGAKGDGAADDGHALQEAVWLGARLRLPTTESAGCYKTSTPIKRETHDWLSSPYQTVPFGRLPGPDNGIVWGGPSQELMAIEKLADFPPGEYLISFDGNPDGISSIVGSRPMAQGKNSWSGMRLRGLGRDGETDDKLVFVRGVWTQEWIDIGMREASGDFVTADTGAVAPANEEVDNIGSWRVDGCRFFEGGAATFTIRECRIAGLSIYNSEFRGFGTWGINGSPIYSEIHGNVFANIGNREDPTTGAIRITDAATSAEARTLKISSNVFENNFNHDIDLVMCRGARVLDNSFHTFLPAAGPVANKASLKLRAAGTDVTHTIEIAGNRWPAYAAPSDGGGWYDCPHIRIDVGVKGVTWHGNVHEGVGTHLKAASPNRLHLLNWPTTYNYVRTGAAPVQSFKNYAVLT